MYIALASKRARSRVEYVVGRPLPWLCGWRGAHGPTAGCTEITDAEWASVQARQWAGIKVCRWCTELAAKRQQLPLITREA